MNLRRVALTTLTPLALGLSVLVYQGPGHLWFRAHAGDALVVMFLVGLLGCVSSWSIGRRLLCVGVVAACVECAQLFGGSAERSVTIQLLVGSHFDPLDFAYYAIGLALAAAVDRVHLSAL